jgi:hypothetical protein
VPINYAALVFDDWYSWEILQFSDAAWPPAADQVAQLDGVALRACIAQEPLVAAYKGGGNGSEVYLLADNGTPLSLPEEVLASATHLASVRRECANGQQVEVTRRQVGGVDRYLIRANAAVVGYLSEANAATIAAALTA